MVWRKLLAGLGLGGVEADTVLAPTPVAPNGALTGQVNLRVKSDTAITSITLILVARGPAGEIEIARQRVAAALTVSGGTSHSVPFTFAVPAHAPFTVLYGQMLPGFSTGIRTELTVSSGSAKGDFDPVRIEAGSAQQHLMDALGTIGAKFAGNAVRSGMLVGLPVPAAQAVTFYGPVPAGQQLGPHVPQVTFVLAPSESSLTVVAELPARPGTGERHDLSTADLERLSSTDDGWVTEVDGWLVSALKNAGQQAPGGAFLQQASAGYGQPGPQQPYGYGGRAPAYQYDGYRRGSGIAGTVMAGMAGGALGFLGTMMIADLLTPDMPMDTGATADPGATDAGADYDTSGYDTGADYGGDFGGGDFGGDFGGF